MPGRMRIVVDIDDFLAAAFQSEFELADPLADALVTLRAALADTRSMGGDDATGAVFAAAYDQAAAATVAAVRDSADRGHRLASLFAQSGRN